MNKNARRHLHHPLKDSWHGDWGVAHFAHGGNMSCPVMIGPDERHAFLFWVVLLFPWLRHISVLNHNCGKAYTHLTPTYVNSISLKTARSERMQPSILWKLAGLTCWLSCGQSLEPAKGHIWQSRRRNLSLQDGAFRKGSWVLEQANGKWNEVFNIKDILLGIFLVAFYKMRWKGNL